MEDKPFLAAAEAAVTTVLHWQAVIGARTNLKVGHAGTHQPFASGCTFPAEASKDCKSTSRHQT